MRNVLSCVIAVGLLSTMGCATSMDAPEESETSAEVRLGWNWVQVPAVWLRSCNNPGACAVTQLPCGDDVYVDYVDFNTGMARSILPEGWVLASALSGSFPLPGCP